MSQQPQLWSDVSKFFWTSSLLRWRRSWWAGMGNVFIVIVTFRLIVLQNQLIHSFRLCCSSLCSVESRLPLLKWWSVSLNFLRSLHNCCWHKNESESQGKLLENEIFFSHQKPFNKTSLTGWDRQFDLKQVKFVEPVQQMSHVQRIWPIGNGFTKWILCQQYLKYSASKNNSWDKMSYLVINILDIWIIFRTMSEGRHQTESLKGTLNDSQCVANWLCILISVLLNFPIKW